MHEKSFINSVAEFRYHGLLFDAVLYAGKKTAEARLSSCDNEELSLMANIRLVDACKTSLFFIFSGCRRGHIGNPARPLKCFQHIFGPRREKTCLRGFRQSEFQTSLFSFGD